MLYRPVSQDGSLSVARAQKKPASSYLLLHLFEQLERGALSQVDPGSDSWRREIWHLHLAGQAERQSHNLLVVLPRQHGLWRRVLE